MEWIEPVELRGPHARLVPLDTSHRDALSRAAADGELWRLWYTTVPSPETMADAIAERLALRDSGAMIPFTVIDARSEEPVGMTAFGNVDHTHKRLEIGWTWYAARVQRTALNTDAKRLLLTHAFETLGCIAVELRTHALNLASRRAIERLGARLDGILRHHRRTENGDLRDTCVYSIIAPDWPTVRTHLTWLLERHRD